MANAGKELAQAIENKVGSTVGIDLSNVISETLVLHEKGPCKFKKGVLQRIVNSKEFKALADYIENEEDHCALREDELAA